ncbi:MAG: two-component regulator propeller domain-containing protein [Anaerolineae bacterium]|nr:two-component regulator propeller domain-containing protein [Anaerolineae bacterium]
MTYQGYIYDYENEKLIYHEPPLVNGKPNPANPWATFIYFVSQHHRNRVNAWQIFNELESGFPSGWDPDCNCETPITYTYLPPPIVYTWLVSDAIAVLEVTNPGDPIVLGSPLTDDAWDLAKGTTGRWYDQVLGALKQYGVEGRLSAIGLHSYGEPRLSYELVTRLQHNTRLSFWLTETGLHIGEPNKEGECPSRLPCGSAEEQAAYVIQQYVWALRAFQETGRWGKIFHFAFRDTDLPWGLLQGSEPRPAYYAFQFLGRLLNGATYDSFEKQDRYVRMTFVKPNQRISFLWVRKRASEYIRATISATTPNAQAILYSQTGLPIRSVTAREGIFEVELPPPTHLKGTMIDEPSPSGDPDDTMIGGAVLIFVESVASTSPTGSAFVICRNGRPVGTALQGYDKDSGLASLSVSCSPARTYDLSWTQPGRFYAGVVREVPPPGHTCTLTLTDRAGLSITQSLSGDICWNGQGPDSEPGNDHPDDNLSAADAPPAPSAALGAGPVGQFLALPEGARIPARVAILWRGAAHDLWWLLAQLGEPADLIGTDFDPIATAAQYPVLLIPSGGLYGMESSPAFRARLEEYARRGGTIVALAQQHGYEYGALPGGQVSGYGWTEDNSCFAASLYLSQWHPILSGFTQPTLDAHVDGYFTTLPEDARVLLSRTANGMPAAILYPYPSPSQRGAEGGSGGWVFATTIYDDWGTANGQSSADARTLLRDLLAWAIDDEGESEGGLPLFAPGSPITLTFPITNSTPYTATAVALRVVDPARQVVLTATLPITIAPGQSAAVHQTLPPTTTLGIWRVDASLLTASGYPLTANFQAIRFFLANPAEPVDLAPELSLSITAPAERFTLDTVTVFTFIARNRSAVTQTVELQYWLPHHTWKTRDPSYGDFHTPNRQTLSVPPYGEVRYRWPRAIRVGMDRLWARLVREGRGVAEAHFAVYGAPGTASVRAALDPSQVQRTGVTTLTVRASPSWESGPFTATFHIRAMDAAGTLFHTATLTAPVMGGWLLEPFTHPITLPASAAAGRGYVWAEARAPDGRIAGGAFAIFTVPPSPLAFSPVLLPLQGGTVVSPGLVVTNTSTALPVEHGTVTLTLTTPGQNVTPTASAPFTLAPASSSLLTLPLDLPPLAFGTYTLTVETADEYGERRADAPWPATVLVAGSLDRPFYRARDVARLDLTLVNPGPFLLPLTTTLQSPIADRQSPVVLAPYGTLTATWDVPIPANVEAGRYGLTLTLALPGGDALTRTLAVVEIPPASLDISVAPRSLLAGDVLSVTLANTGGADAAVTGTLRVVDARGQAVVSETVATAVPAGGEWRLALPLPPRMVGGFYTLRGRIVEGTTGAHHDLFVPLQVAGLEARLSVSTDRPEYLTTDVLTLTAVMTAGARSLEAGTLTWRVVQPAGVPRSLAPQFVTVTADLPFWVNALAVDDQGSLWIATNEGVRRLTSGEWRAYTPANSGLTGNDVRDVEIDPQGNVWFATWPFWDENAQQEVGGGVSVLLASGEWVTYTTTNSGLTSNYVRDVEIDPSGQRLVRYLALLGQELPAGGGRRRERPPGLRR